jgi:hypothetical protein
MGPSSKCAVLAWAVALTACATTTFVSSWTAPGAQSLRSEGNRVAVVVMSKNDPMRLSGEDSAAQEITRRGGQGIPAYTLLKDEPGVSEGIAQETFARAGINAVLTLRPTTTRTQVSSSPSMYPAYWGGYYGFGWGSPWSYGPAFGPEIRTDTFVYVETRVYSMRQNKLVWTGESRTVNPGDVDSLMRDVIGAVAQELRSAGLL